jgi:two-component system OmpR family response regulator
VKERHTILVVDDDPHFRELYHTALRIRGFNVATASDGLAALEVIDNRLPSLIILDLNMPRVDGWDVLRELHSNESTRAIPVIVVTGADVQKTMLQASAIVHKPVMPDQVVPLIERHLRAA